MCQLLNVDETPTDIGFTSVDTQNCANIECGLHHQVSDIKNVLENIWDNIIRSTKSKRWKTEEYGAAPAKPACPVAKLAWPVPLPPNLPETLLKLHSFWDGRSTSKIALVLTSLKKRSLKELKLFKNTWQNSVFYFFEMNKRCWMSIVPLSICPNYLTIVVISV